LIGSGHGARFGDVIKGGAIKIGNGDAICL
jgi:hypothetical protein